MKINLEDILSEVKQEAVSPKLEDIVQEGSTVGVPDISKINLDAINEGSQGLSRLIRKDKGLQKKGNKEAGRINVKKAYFKKKSQAKRSEQKERKAAGSLAHLIGKKQLWIKPRKSNKTKEVDESILIEFAEIVRRGKELIEEMTTCGMLGVNMAARPGKSVVKKKNKNKALLAKLNR